MATTTLEMKLLIDAEAKKVLFAEVGNDCVDFLFYILSLPVSTIVQLLTKQGMIGSLPNLYGSLENLKSYIQQNEAKQTVLNPAFVPIIPLLLTAPSNQQAATKKFYIRGNCYNYFTDSNGLNRSKCRISVHREIHYVASASTVGVGSSFNATASGIVKGVVTYMIMDDLSVTPMSTISSITLINKFQVKDVAKLEEKTVRFGMDEAVKMLGGSLKSKTVLTDVFFNKAWGKMNAN